MPELSVNGGRYSYEERGSGPPVVFAHGLTFDRHMWDHQVETLSSRYRCIAFDFLGHGGSPAGGGEYTLEDEAEGLHTLMTALGASPSHVVGLSMGGMVAMRLALAHPEDVRSLALLDTSAEEEVAERRPQYEGMVAMARAQGPGSIVDLVLPIMFSQAFIQGQPQALAQQRERFLSLNMDGIELATKAVTRRTSVLDRMPQITAPTLVIVGSEDVSTTPDKAQRIAEGIGGARLETVDGAGHMTPIEQPERISRLLSDFLAEVESASPK